MRLTAGTIGVILLSAGCGYVGPVLPPSPQIPAAITNLAAVERGDEIIITFTTPARTTDGVAVTQFSNINLRVEPIAQGASQAKDYSVELPAPSNRQDPQPKAITYKLQVSEWSGRRVSIAVQAGIKKSGHLSGWSNKALLDVIAPLAAPAVRAEGSSEGIVLKWDAAEGVEYRVERQSPSDKQPLEIGTAESGRYVDSSAAYDTEYQFRITAKKGMAESLPSPPVSFSASDIYAPAIPTGVTALAGPDAVNVAWQRNTEADLRGYWVYRSTSGEAYQRQEPLVTLPTYVDKKVEHGKTFSYKLSAIDQKGNESAQSSPVEAQY